MPLFGAAPAGTHRSGAALLISLAGLRIADQDTLALSGYILLEPATSDSFNGASTATANAAEKLRGTQTQIAQ